MFKTTKKPSELFTNTKLAADPTVQDLIQAGRDRAEIELEDVKAKIVTLEAEAKAKAAKRAEEEAALADDPFLKKIGVKPSDLVTDGPAGESESDDEAFWKTNGMSEKDVDPDKDESDDEGPFLKANGMTEKDEPDEDPFLKANGMSEKDFDPERVAA